MFRNALSKARDLFGDIRETLTDADAPDLQKIVSGALRLDGRSLVAREPLANYFASDIAKARAFMEVRSTRPAALYAHWSPKNLFRSNTEN